MTIKVQRSADDLYDDIKKRRFSDPLNLDPQWGSFDDTEKHKAYARWALYNLGHRPTSNELFESLKNGAFFKGNLHQDPLWPTESQEAKIAWARWKEYENTLNAEKSALAAIAVSNYFGTHAYDEAIQCCKGREILIQEVTGPVHTVVGRTVTYVVTRFNIDGVTAEEKQGVNWAIFVDGQRIDLTNKGDTLSMVALDQLDWKQVEGKSISVRPYMKSPTERISVNTKIWPKRSHFVVHSTGGASNDAYYKNSIGKERGVGHVYINQAGEFIYVWPLSERDVFATKTDKDDLTKRGKMIHVELIYGDSPTESQYYALANLYKQAADENFAEALGYLTIVSHKEVDRGILDGHADPTNFNFNHFYDILEANGLPIDSIPKISQERHDRQNYESQKHKWPPELSGIPEND